MVVEWEIQCVIYLFYGTQIGPENNGMWHNELKYLFSSTANIDTCSPSSDKLTLKQSTAFLIRTRMREQFKVFDTQVTTHRDEFL